MIEPRVWGFVSDLLRDPEKIRAGLDAMIEEDCDSLQGNPERETKAWLSKIAEADRMRTGYQEMTAQGLMSFEELGTKLQELEEIRRMGERHIEDLSRRKKKIEELKRDRATLLESYAGMVPEALDGLSPEERHRVYRMMRLRVEIAPDGGINISGTLTETPGILGLETVPGDRSRSNRS